MSLSSKSIITAYLMLVGCVFAQTMSGVQFYYASDQSLARQVCLTVLPADGGSWRIGETSCNDNDLRQRWNVTNNFHLRNLANGLCVRGFLGSNDLFLETCDTGISRDRWQFSDSEGLIMKRSPSNQLICLALAQTNEKNGQLVSAPCSDGHKMIMARKPKTYLTHLLNRENELKQAPKKSSNDKFTTKLDEDNRKMKMELERLRKKVPILEKKLKKIQNDLKASKNANEALAKRLRQTRGIATDRSINIPNPLTLEEMGLNDDPNDDEFDDEE